MELINKIDLFLKSAENKEYIGKYQDPQKFMGDYTIDDASEVYSNGMYLFEILTGKDFFEYINMPQDEYFMMADAEGPVISKKHLPPEYVLFSDILEKMTMFKRENRISMEECILYITKMFCDNDKTAETNDEKSGFPYISHEYDYGIILNNKRFGRIQFIKLLDNEKGSLQKFDIPVEKEESFRVAVSRRHKSNSDVTNPSSVFGDCIEPYAIIELRQCQCDKLGITFEEKDGKLSVLVIAEDSMGNKIADILENNINFYPY